MPYVVELWIEEGEPRWSCTCPPPRTDRSASTAWRRRSPWIRASHQDRSCCSIRPSACGESSCRRLPPAGRVVETRTGTRHRPRRQPRRTCWPISWPNSRRIGWPRLSSSGPRRTSRRRRTSGRARTPPCRGGPRVRRRFRRVAVDHFGAALRGSSSGLYGRQPGTGRTRRAPPAVGAGVGPGGLPPSACRLRGGARRRRADRLPRAPGIAPSTDRRLGWLLPAGDRLVRSAGCDGGMGARHRRSRRAHRCPSPGRANPLGRGAGHSAFPGRCGPWG